MPQMGYSMTQATRLAQKMSPQQYMASSLLQATIQDLRMEIRQRLETNPAIEDVKWRDDPLLSSVIGDPAGGKSAADHDVPLDFTPDGEAASRMLSSEDGRTDEFLGNMESASSDDPDERRLSAMRESRSKMDADREERRQHLFDSAVADETLETHLGRQIMISDFTAEERELAAIVVGNLDEDGYFIGSIPDIVMASGESEAKIRAVLAKISDEGGAAGLNADGTQVQYKNFRNIPA